MISDAELYKLGYTRREYEKVQQGSLESKLRWASRAVEAMLHFTQEVDPYLNRFLIDIYSDTGSEESRAASEIAQDYINIYQHNNTDGNK